MHEIEYEWNDLHARILDDLLKAYAQAGVDCFILRNYQGLPERNDSKDVDVIIRPGTYRRAKAIFLDILRKHDVSNYYVVKYERVHCWFGIDVDKSFAIHIDLIEGYVNKGFELIPFDTLYANTIDYKGYRVLNDQYDIAMLLLYKVINAKTLKQAYREQISVGYARYAVQVNRILESVMPKSLLDEVVAHLAAENYDWFERNARNISEQTKKLAMRRHPLKTSARIVSFLAEKVHRIIMRPKRYRKFIAVEAPDGTGKTTFIDGLRVELAKLFVCDIEKMHVYHFRPTLLPNLGAVGEKMKVMEQDKDFTNPHRNKPASPLSSLLRMGYYWIDYIVGGWIVIRKDVQFDQFSIFDRYIYDFVVDPLRSRINLPKKLRIAFAKSVPQPDVTFVLMTDAETVYCRKQELTLEEIDRQLGEFSALERMLPNAVELDAGQTPDEIVRQAARIIVDRYTRKVRA
ncbi:hypothetical protein [Bifidobacterium miconisargentati]|uniref:hypothetical protein n=1 Tax=Bifidobacterium miconisargentati TaxID=2834437 RepID=UPI001BDCFDA4|nr:hypothetical protein [Bifidobacterium miconisargentati]MBW3090919.1 hypothetical protein [Bifidobacterium miconisargentati]